METRFSRKDLHALVWAEPISKVAASLGVSDVALSKACAKIFVPVPPRGYWARKAVGKPTFITDLPPRPLGLDDEIQIPGGLAVHYYGCSDGEALGPLPPRPTFEDPIKQVRARVDSLVAPVPIPRLADQCHTLMAADEHRRAEDAAHPYLAYRSSPLFGDPTGRRRLRLLSALLSAVALHGGRVDGSGGLSAEWVRVVVGHHGVVVGIRMIETKTRNGKGTDSKVEVERKCVIELGPVQDQTRPADRTWEDGDHPLEKQLRGIVVEVLVEGENNYREWRLRAHRYRADRKAQLEGLARERVAKAVEAERARLAELERQRVERLLGEAAGLEKARAIRRYVSYVTAENARSDMPMEEAELADWSRWALAQADRLDPILNGDFRRPREE